MELRHSRIAQRTIAGLILIVAFPLIVQIEHWRPWSLWGIAACYLVVMFGKRSIFIACALLGAATGGCAYLLFEILLMTYYSGGIPVVWPWVRNGGAALIIALPCAALGAFLGAVSWECFRKTVRRNAAHQITSLRQESQNMF